MTKTRRTLLSLGLMAVAGLVHGTIGTTAVPALALTGPSSPDTAPGTVAEPMTTPAVIEALPSAVAEMREAILEAVRSGRLEDLKVALDLNELKPELAAVPVPDPIAFWRQRSADGEGRDILTALGVLLDLPYGVQPLGKDPENSRVFVWPAFVDRSPATLGADEAGQLQRLESASKVQAMKVAGTYTGWRVVIGADGVWHSFRRYD